MKRKPAYSRGAQAELVCAACGSNVAEGQRTWQIGAGLVPNRPQGAICMDCLMKAFHADAAQEQAKRVTAHEPVKRSLRSRSTRRIVLPHPAQERSA